MTIIDELFSMYRLVGLASVAVVLSIVLDLCSGLLKARVRGERCTSYGYARTSLKLLCDVGLVVVFSFVDSFMLLGGLWEVVGLHSLVGVPVLSLVSAAWLCFVQGVSIKENSSGKSEKQARQKLEAMLRLLMNSNVLSQIKTLQDEKQENHD